MRPIRSNSLAWSSSTVVESMCAIRSIGNENCLRNNSVVIGNLRSPPFWSTRGHVGFSSGHFLSIRFDSQFSTTVEKITVSLLEGNVWGEFVEFRVEGMGRTPARWRGISIIICSNDGRYVFILWYKLFSEILFSCAEGSSKSCDNASSLFVSRAPTLHANTFTAGGQWTFKSQN